tara:strand:+ start:574 stop:915 length:342 start_codon:yes stop_codon:yes gene_type:complete
VPKINPKDDWGFCPKGTTRSLSEAKAYVCDSLDWLCKKHDVTKNDALQSQDKKALQLRDTWHFLALESLRPWWSKSEIARFVGKPHSTFYLSWKRQEKRHNNERLLQDGAEGS